MQITRVSCNARRAVTWACLTVLLLVPAPGASGQPPDRKQDAPQEVRAESKVTSDHTVTIKGQRVAYRATAATQPVLNPEGQAVASVFYVYYQRADVQDQALRPLVFSFNGGPGSASVWMHIGYTGPRFLEVDDEGFPIQP
ncbi:MAG: carboxypeptidase, partial [Acidobacteria bacterium]|nr:carboxypeptidase [Acidobacteriota bacterium]